MRPKRVVVMPKSTAFHSRLPIVNPTKKGKKGKLNHLSSKWASLWVQHFLRPSYMHPWPPPVLEEMWQMYCYSMIQCWWSSDRCICHIYHPPPSVWQEIGEIPVYLLHDCDIHSWRTAVLVLLAAWKGCFALVWSVNMSWCHFASISQQEVEYPYQVLRQGKAFVEEKKKGKRI